MTSKIDKPVSKIYLTGFMGSGKSTVAPLVARRLGWRFLDLDAVIEEQAGHSISAIFASEGEAGFRRREAEALRQVSEASSEDVVATGGGALVREENLQRALGSGLVVYLQAPAKVLAARLEGEAAERPLLQEAGGQPLAGTALVRHLEAMLAQRRPFYQRAHVMIETARQTPQEAAGAVATALRTHQEG